MPQGKGPRRPIRKEPLRVDIENDIIDVTFAARAMFNLLKTFLGNEESRKKHRLDDACSLLFWADDKLLGAVNDLIGKYCGDAKEPAHA